MPFEHIGALRKNLCLVDVGDESAWGCFSLFFNVALKIISASPTFLLPTIILHDNILEIQINKKCCNIPGAEAWAFPKIILKLVLLNEKNVFDL